MGPRESHEVQNLVRGPILSLNSIEADFVVLCVGIKRVIA